MTRKRLRKVLLNEMFGNVRPRGAKEMELSASAIQKCVEAILNSGPTAELPGRELMRDRLERVRTGEEDPNRVRSSLDYRSQVASAECADEFGIPHLQVYIRKKAFNIIAKDYGLRRVK